jgi:IclR family KDG regulon transcriptional repressor
LAKKSAQSHTLKSRLSETGRDRSVVDVGKKMFMVLEALTKDPRNPPSLEEITHSVGFAKTTVYRFLNTMKKIGYVDQVSPSGAYVLSEKFFELSRPAVPYQYLMPLAKPWLEQLRLRTGGTVSLGILDQGSLLYLAVIESQDPYRYAMKPGDYFYAHATAMGKCLLAYLSHEEVDDVIRTRGLPRLTRNTITTGTQLFDELAKVKNDGFSINVEENAEGVTCVGAPIWGPEGKPSAALSISGPSVRMDGVLDSMKNEALRVARQLSLTLGCEPPVIKQSSTPSLGTFSQDIADTKLSQGVTVFSQY